MTTPEQSYDDFVREMETAASAHAKADITFRYFHKAFSILHNRMLLELQANAAKSGIHIGDALGEGRVVDIDKRSTIRVRITLDSGQTMFTFTAAEHGLTITHTDTVLEARP